MPSMMKSAPTLGSLDGVAIVDALPEAVLVSDGGDIITFWNAAAEALLGYTGDAVVGRPIGLVLPTVTAVRELVHAAPSSGRAAEMDLVACTKNGLLRQVGARVVPLPGAPQGTHLWVLRPWDEDRTRIELEQQNRRLRSVGQALPDLMFVVSLDGHIDYQQEPDRKDLVVAADQIPQLTVEDIFEATLAQRLMAAVGRAVQSGVVQQVEYDVEFPAVRQRFEARMARLSDEEATVIVRNVTEERARQEALAEERTRLANVLAMTSAIIYVARLPDLSIEFVSESGVAVLGFTPEEIMAPNFWVRMVHPDDRKRVEAELPKLFMHGRHVHEYRHRHKAGGYRWLRDEIRLVLDPEGKPVRAVGASFDITERKLSELRLHALSTIGRLVSGASSQFLECRGTVPDQVVLDTLKGIGEFMQAERMYVVERNAGTLVMTHEWCGEGARSERESTPKEEDYSYLLSTLLRGESLWVPSVAAIAEKLPPARRERLLSHGIERILAVPLQIDGEVRGLIGINNPVIEPLDPKELAGLLQILANAMSAAFRRAADEAAREALNTRLSAQAAQQRALLDYSEELACTRSREGILKATSLHARRFMGVDRVSMSELVNEGQELEFLLLNQSPKMANPDENQVYVRTDRPTKRVPLAALKGTATWRVFETSQEVSTLDYQIDHFLDWKHLAESNGLRHCAVLPLPGPQGPIGTLNLGLTGSSPLTSAELEHAAQFASVLASHLSIHQGREAMEALNAELEQRVEARTRELRESELRFEQLFLDAPQAMIIVGTDQRVIQANRNARKLFGYSEEEFKQLPVEAMIPAVFRARHREQMQGYQENPQWRTMAKGRVVPAVRKDGSVFSGEIGLVSMDLGGSFQILAGVSDISERLAAEAEVKRSLREKETLLKEIHHRVKNNLQIISSLLKLQSNQMPSERAKQLLEESVFRVRSMALIHEQLYGVASLESIDMGSYARVLADSLRATLAPSATIEVRVKVVEVTVEQAVPLGLILNELLTNAFKYGVRPAEFTGPRRTVKDLLLEVGTEGNQIRLAVTDSGPGLREGLDPHKVKTLGMQLIRSLMRQLRGQLEVDVDNGTRFVVKCEK